MHSHRATRRLEAVENADVTFPRITRTRDRARSRVRSALSTFSKKSKGCTAETARLRFSSGTSDLAKCRFHEEDSTKRQRSSRVSYTSIFYGPSCARRRHSHRFRSLRRFRVPLITHALLGTLWRKCKCKIIRSLRCTILYSCTTHLSHFIIYFKPIRLHADFRANVFFIIYSQFFSFVFYLNNFKLNYLNVMW